MKHQAPQLAKGKGIPSGSQDGCRQVALFWRVIFQLPPGDVNWTTLQASSFFTRRLRIS